MATPVDNNIDEGTGGTVATPAVSLNLDPSTGFMVATPVDNNIDEGTNIDDAAMDDSISEGDQSRLDDELLQLMSTDCDTLRQENRELRTKLNRGSLEEDGFRDDNDKVLFFYRYTIFHDHDNCFCHGYPICQCSQEAITLPNVSTDMHANANESQHSVPRLLVWGLTIISISHFLRCSHCYAHKTCAFVNSVA